jgi:hypothetical protein
MKKERSLKKLSLNRETVRSLDDRSMEKVDGGATTTCSNFCTVTQCSNCRNCSAAC